MQSLRDVLPQLVRNLGLGQRYRAELIVLHWRDIVGAEIASHTQPGKIRRGLMTVAVKNAVWAHHLSTLKEEIMAKINAFAGEKAVNDLKFQAGYFQNDQNQEINDDDAAEPPVIAKKPALNDSDRQRIDAMVSAIDDDDVRRRLGRLLARDVAARKAKEQQEWTRCPGCGVLCPPRDKMCAACRLAARIAAIHTARQLLREAPWLSYRECLPYAEGCRLTDYRTIKAELTDKLIKEIGPNEEDGLALRTLAMMFFGAKPQAVDGEMLAATLDKVRRKKHVSAPRG